MLAHLATLAVTVAGMAWANSWSKPLALGNVLIAMGTLVLAASGTLSARLGELESFEVTLLAGISLLFLGFLVATPAPRGAAVPRPHPVPVNAAGVTPVSPHLRGTGSAQDAAQDLAGRVPR